jgi:hypothetical protein
MLLNDLLTHPQPETGARCLLGREEGLNERSTLPGCARSVPELSGDFRLKDYLPTV